MKLTHVITLLLAIGIPAILAISNPCTNPMLDANFNPDAPTKLTASITVASGDLTMCTTLTDVCCAVADINAFDTAFTTEKDAVAAVVNVVATDFKTKLDAAALLFAGVTTKLDKMCEDWKAAEVLEDAADLKAAEDDKAAADLEKAAAANTTAANTTRFLRFLANETATNATNSTGNGTDTGNGTGTTVNEKLAKRTAAKADRDAATVVKTAQRTFRFALKNATR